MNYPLVVIATQTDQATFAAWRETAVMMVIIAASDDCVNHRRRPFYRALLAAAKRLNAARAEIVKSSKILALAEAEAFRQRDFAQQNMRLDAAIENMPQGLCMFDPEQKLIVCNKQYAELYGLNKEQTKPGTSLTAILR